MAPSFPLIRLVVLSTVVVFALIALGVAAAFTSSTSAYLTESGTSQTFPFASLGIATAVFTMVTVPAMITLEILRPGGPTSMIIVEILWLGFLSILWLSTGADAAGFSGGASLAFGCGNARDETDLGFDSDVPTSDSPTEICQEMSALEAFAFLNWIVLMGYIGMLLVVSLVAANRKHTSVWTSSVANAPFSAPGKNSTVSSSYGAGGHPAGYNNTSGSVDAGTVHV
ncbi:hypothetical protein B0H12DRAFT_1230919 [Mycena haematopus]|nr:hypothetical protein B0H12DRAFT_1230919 [Mycena haematopus]